MEEATSKASSEYLAAYYDPGIGVRAENPVEIVRVERERLYTLYFVALAASQIPKRIGGEATQEELRADKKRCHRIAHVARMSFGRWGGELAGKKEPDLKKEAAQIDWDKWWEAHQVALRNRITALANWGLAQDKEGQKWTKSAVQRLENELSWLTYAMR